jgi:small-conductance mechanosensitive channel
VLVPTDIVMLLVATALAIGGFLPRLRVIRRLIWGWAALSVVTALYPRSENHLATLLFGGSFDTPHLPSALFGVAWWLLGAWLLSEMLNLVLRRTIFPNDNKPHSRRLLADLASGLVYAIAFVGIMDSVLKQPVSTVLATSGVLAIVLGLALQNTLADVFAGIALNIERPFRAGDWITVPGEIEGQVIEINWRATRIKTLANDMIVIPNSVIAKNVVTNHRPLIEPNFCTIEIKVDQKILPSRVISALEEAAASAHGTVKESVALVYAHAFADTLIVYRLSFAIRDFSRTPIVRSGVISQVADAMNRLGIQIGTPVMDVHIVQDLPSGVDGEYGHRSVLPLAPGMTSSSRP